MTEAHGAAGADGAGPQGTPKAVGKAARRGALATMLGQFATQIGSVTATIILARLLTPEDFGLIAVTQSVMGAGALISLAGVNAGLVTRRGDVDRAASTYFWMALAFGTTVAVVIAALAKPITALVGIPEAAPLVAVLAMGFPFTLVILVPQALLLRRLAFGAWNVTTIAPALLYFVGEVTLVWAGLGAWGVILAQVISAATGAVLALVMARWLPRHGFAPSELRQDAGLLGGTSLSQVLMYLYKNVDYWAVGRVLGAGALGAYYVAYVLPNVIRQRMTAVYRTVLLPLFTNAGSRAEATRRWRHSTTVMMFISLPILVGLASVAEPVTLLFFGDRWHGAIAPMQVLAVGSVVDVMVIAVGTMAMAMRQIGRHTVVVGFRLVVTALSAVIALSVWHSITAVAWAVSISGLVTLVVQDFVVSRPLGIGMNVVLSEFLKIAAPCIPMALATLFVVGRMELSSPLLRLFAGVATGVVVFMGMSWVIDRRFTAEMIKEVRAIFASSATSSRAVT